MYSQGLRDDRERPHNRRDLDVAELERELDRDWMDLQESHVKDGLVHIVSLGVLGKLEA